MMAKRILVAYASRAGATAGVAEAIGQGLAALGSQVDVRPMTEIEDVESYGAVVAGSAIQAQHWLPEAMRFLEMHREALSHRPFAAFLVCMTLAIPKHDYREAVAQWMAPVRRFVQPVSEGLFAGALDIRKVPSFRERMKFRLSVLLGVWSEGDHRDWPAIRAWAESIHPLLLQGERATAGHAD
jgi:menaquinone-dependent protoporphyrinogen oxidase